MEGGLSPSSPIRGIWSQALLRELENECGRFDSALPHQRP